MRDVEKSLQSGSQAVNGDVGLGRQDTAAHSPALGLPVVGDIPVWPCPSTPPGSSGTELGRPQVVSCPKSPTSRRRDPEVRFLESTPKVLRVGFQTCSWMWASSVSHRSGIGAVFHMLDTVTGDWPNGSVRMRVAVVEVYFKQLNNLKSVCQPKYESSTRSPVP